MFFRRGGMFFRRGGLLMGGATCAGVALGARLAQQDALCKPLVDDMKTNPDRPGNSQPAGLQQLRADDFALTDHYYGKSLVRVLRVRRDTPVHTVQE